VSANFDSESSRIEISFAWAAAKSGGHEETYSLHSILRVLFGAKIESI
jgi:hypothetical protein